MKHVKLVFITFPKYLFMALMLKKSRTVDYFYDMKILSLFVILSAVLFSCDSQKKKDISTGENVARYAKYLRIIEKGNLTTIEILSPETGEVEQTLNVSKEMIKTSHFLQVPVSKMAVLSSTHVGMLSKLNAIDKIAGITNRLYVYNKELLESIEKDKVVELGEEGQIPVEALLKTKCQALIYSGFGKQYPHQKQLNAAMVRCIANYDWRELHPLGKAEWILLFGYLTGKEKQAKLYFDKIEKEYLALEEKASKLKNFPTVLEGNLFGESWFAPAGESFKAKLLKDAHVRYQYADTKGTGSLPLTLEKILSDNLDTEHWINPGFPTKEKLFAFHPKLKYLGPVTKNKIFDFSKSGNRYWELSAIEPQKILSDYLSIFHPTEFPKENLYFYQEVK
ncbi:MAG: ABC transporter substrate-binding protein [Crocinitomicaceae bacterium]